MAYDSPYWKKDEDELTEQEKLLRAEDMSYGRFRQHMEREWRKRELREANAETVPDLPQVAEPEDPPKPSKTGKAIRRALLILLFMGGPSVGTLVVSGYTKDNNPVQMDFGQALEGVGIYGLLLTFVVVVITVFVTVSSGE